jgi:sarcosine oxidase
VSQGGLDLIVVGLGAAGSATLYQTAKRGARVLGLDRHHPPHDQGSSHGETRITRQAIGEGLEYVPLALRAHDLWRNIEAASGEILMRQVGALLISSPAMGAVHHGKHDFLEQTIAAARAFSIAHETLDAAEVRARYPQFLVRHHEVAYFEPGAGMLYPERCIAAQLALAKVHGAEVHTGETVLAVEPIAAGARVTTDRGTYRAAKVAVCAGAWTPGLLGGALGASLILHRQTQHWFEPDDPAPFAPGRFPVFIWMHGAGEGDWFYGFPRDPALGGVKVAAEQFARVTPDPESLDRSVALDEAMAVHAGHVAGRIEGLPPSWLRSAPCVYTTAPGSRFIIGPDPAREGVIVVSACSGHGFKHSAAIGEAVATLALEGVTPEVLKPFAPLLAGG